MKFLRAGISSTAVKARWAWGAGALLLAGCHMPSDTSQVTGSHGGLLPGMSVPKPVPAQSPNPPGYTGIVQQVQPNGRQVANEYLNGQLLSETWYSSLRLPEKIIYYVDGTIVAGVAEFGPDGKMTRRTYYYVGSPQVERVEEFANGTTVARFTTYWPNGNKRIFSETDVAPTTGLDTAANGDSVNRVQEWYANGRPKSLTQIHVGRDARGQIAYQEKQGRQTTWNEDGYRLTDMEFDHDRWVYDYLADKRSATPKTFGQDHAVQP
jgi:antitoxin component YwqK of YwqJK toxin-antitoxin module